MNIIEVKSCINLPWRVVSSFEVMGLLSESPEVFVLTREEVAPNYSWGLTNSWVVLSVQTVNSKGAALPAWRAQPSLYRRE